MKIKRTLSLVLAVMLLLSIFTGCQPEESGDILSVGKATPVISVEWPKPTGSLTYDELTPTDKLIVYVMDQGYSVMYRQIERYEALYNVEVETVVVEGGIEAYIERVTNDLAGGNGPDVVFIDFLPDMDIAKAALNNSFLDLTEILASDEGFCEDDYMAGVFDAGCYKGRQYVIPTTFITPYYLSAKTKLEEIGFDWSDIEKKSDFLEEISRIMQSLEQKGPSLKLMSTKNMFFDFLVASGIRLIDYESGAVLPDEAALDEFLHAYKTYFPYDYDESGLIYSFSSGADDLAMGKYYFWPDAGNNLENISWNIDTLIEKNVGYELQSLPGQCGETVGYVYGQVAISASAKNQLNAYNFIKMLLSAEVQCDKKLRTNGIPVLKAAFETIILGKTQWAGTTDEGQTCTYSGYKSTQLSNEELDALIEIITQTDRFITYVPNNIFYMMMDSMLPFLRDEASYDDCLKELKNKLAFYLSE